MANKSSQNLTTLFIIHAEITSPLVHSQGIPHIKELSKRGIRFFFLSFEHRGFKKIPWIKKEFEQYGITWRTLSYMPWSFFPASLLDIIRGIFYTIWLAKRKKIRIIHTRSYIPGIMAWVVKKILGTKFIFDMRGLMADEYVACGSWSQSSLKYKSAKFIEKKLLHNADVIVVVTKTFKDYVQDVLLKGLKKNIVIIPNCVDTKKFYFDTAKRERLLAKLNLRDKFILVYSGSAAKWHLIEEMIDFFTVLKKIKPNAHFLVLTYSKEKFAEVITKKGLSKNDYTLVKVLPRKMPAYLSVANLAVSFIKTTFTKTIAAFPVKFAEYLAMGLPVIINSNIGGTDQMVKESRLGIVIDTFNKDSYQKAINKIVEILKEEDSLRERCQKFAKNNLSLKQAVNKYEVIYRTFRK